MKILLVVTFFLSSVASSAQDIIVKIDGTKILSKVLEVNIENVKYKKQSNLNGPTYTISKSEIISIYYENGEKDFFDKNPSYPGGEDALLLFLKENIKYPQICFKKGITGRVVCSFIIEKDGSVSNVMVVNSVHPLLDQEAVRIVQSMSKWTPGVKDGEVKRVKYSVPITFDIR